MKNLFIALLSVFVIAACNNNPSGSERDFQPYQVGTWFVNSPDEANWVGQSSKGKLKTDTVYVDQPDGRGLKIIDLEEREKFHFVIIDSLFPMDSLLSIGSHEIVFPENSWGDGTFGRSGYETDGVNGNLHTSFSIFFNCDEENPHVDDSIDYVMKREDGSVYQSLSFPIEGFDGVLNDVVCK